MPTERQIDAMNLYRELIGEVWSRLSYISIASKGFTGLPTSAVKEYSYLQLRMICELIALGCLVAHGDIEATQRRSLQKEYAADKIMAALTELHPDFYPHPTMVTYDKESGEGLMSPAHHLNYLTKANLIELNGRCGDELHRGSIRRLIKPKTDASAPADNVTQWTTKIVNLLGQHTIFAIDSKTSFMCTAQQHGRGSIRLVVYFLESEQRP